MYTPKYFEINDQEELLAFVKAFPFATLVSNGEDGLNAEHIPMLVHVDDENRVCLQAHIAKANKLWQNLANQADVLVIFQGENAYISPNWYPSKKVDGRAVPTWNYRAVHIQGTINFIHDIKWKLALLEKLTNIHEKEQPVPWSISDAPQEYIDRLQAAVVGIEITVTDIQGKYKLSQNQTTENKNGVRDGLAEAKQPLAELIKP
ncbi:FMN-binding negative transcriptional regulator [Marinomonas foliarum]|uniref:PaiB family negative transcriptional regulator n=1 Tax=Marinomonas foliarum TaxID=491950 RepID=A0A369AJL8_9GAMM|nr:FMN-binding negative transcriptional regulator [Marinomonas foliarum]RCX08476.1 PaiB family negative transcriptional regulator [Marinomonas foliarum]